MKKLYFVVGSQDLYGDECLKQVAADAPGDGRVPE